MVKSWKMFGERTLMQWDSFESYFLPNFDLDDDPNENDPNEKPSRERRMVNAFRQIVSKPWHVMGYRPPQQK